MIRIRYICRRTKHALLCVFLLVSVVQAQPELRTVALSGQQAPGAPAGVLYSTFNSPVLNDRGQTAFLARLAGVGVTTVNDDGLWSEGTGTLNMVMRGGMPAPGTPVGVNFSLVTDPELNNAGNIAFRSVLTGTGVNANNSQGYWSTTPGSLQLIARSGTQPPGTSGDAAFLNMNQISMNETGEVVFSATLRGTGISLFNDDGIWWQGSGPLALVVRQTGLAAVAPDGLTYTNIGKPAFNDAGVVAFFSGVEGPGFDEVVNIALWRGHPDSRTLVLRTGMPAPGTESGVEFEDFSFGAPGMNASGQLAFLASVAGPGVIDVDSQGVWSQGSGTLSLVARSGAQAPGAPTGEVFYDFYSPSLVYINNAGHTTFYATLATIAPDGTPTESGQGIWTDRSGSLEVVAVDGMSAPGMPPGVLFGNDMNSIVHNQLGQTAFFASLTGTGIDSTNDGGIWATGIDGELELLVREGQLLEVGPSDLRIVGSVFLWSDEGSGNSRNTGFNDRGQIALRATFTDGTHGIFVSNLVAVPEPGTSRLCFLALSGICIRRRTSA
jgi:hypothetical protein